jgi:hypothetical protein
MVCDKNGQKIMKPFHTYYIKLSFCMIGPISGEIFGGQYYFSTVCPILTIPQVYRVKNMKKKNPKAAIGTPEKGEDTTYSPSSRTHTWFCLFNYLIRKGRLVIVVVIVVTTSKQG